MLISKKSQSVLCIRDYLAILIAILLINPIISLSNKAVFAVVSFFWLICAYFHAKKVFLSVLKTPSIICITLYDLLLVINMLVGRGPINTHEVLLLFILFFGEYYYVLGHKEENSLIVSISQFYLFCIIIVSLLRLQSNHNLLRILASGDDTIIREYGSFFTGNYAHVYYCVAYVSVSFLMVRDRIAPFRLLPIIGLYCVFIIRSQYTTGIILSFAFLLTVLTVFNNSSTVKKVLGLYVCALLLLIVLLNYNSLIDYLIARGGSSVGIRLRELRSVINGKRLLVGGDLTQRAIFFKTSFNSFLSHPLFGVGSLSSGYNSAVGGHSTIIDQFARYGIIGGGLYWGGILLHFRLLTRKTSAKKRQLCLKLIAINIIVLAIINVTIDASYYYGMFALLPLLVQLEHRNELCLNDSRQ